MAKMIFVNLPVKDVAASTAFYEALGFTKDARFSNEMASAMNWSDEITVMILGHDFYSTFIPHKTIADSSATNEVLLCLSFDSREAVDAITQKAAAAGGKADIREPQDMGFMILTEDQAETDRLWNAIVGNGGQESQCGWCKDRWGVNWQVTPRRLLELNFDNPDPASARRAMEAMLTMKKIDIAKIEAAAGEG